MPYIRRRGQLAVLSILLCAPLSAAAQELEPGAYWPMPRGFNIVTAVNSVNHGDLTFDPSLPVDKSSATIDTMVGVYTRGLSLAGRSANVSFQVPVVGGHIEGLYRGEPFEIGRFGQADPRIRLGFNLYGAPAMTGKEFAAYRMRTIVGVSVTVVPPLGQYKNTQIVNIGSNRWSLKTELGFSHVVGAWVVEIMAGVWGFTDNDDFVGGRTRTQKPITSVQTHLTYRFRRSTWLAADATFYGGGRTSIDGIANLDLQKNARIGTTFSTSLAPHHSVRVALSRGAYTTIGADFTSLIAGYNFTWMR
jgi:hypothetical protein